MNEEETITAFLREAHAAPPEIPFARVMRAVRASPARAPRRALLRLVPRVAAGLAAAVVALAAVAVLRTPPPSHVARAPLRGWHAPTDFLLADTRTHASTDFLLRAPKLKTENTPGEPR